jgi:hypothetical protein
MIAELFASLVPIKSALYFMQPMARSYVDFRKEIIHSKAIIHVTAKKDIKRLVLSRLEKNNHKTRFIRMHVQKGEKLEFALPISRTPEELTIEYSDYTHTFQVR